MSPEKFGQQLSEAVECPGCHAMTPRVVVGTVGMMEPSQLVPQDRYTAKVKCAACGYVGHAVCLDFLEAEAK